MIRLAEAGKDRAAWHASRGGAEPKPGAQRHERGVGGVLRMSRPSLCGNGPPQPWQACQQVPNGNRINGGPSLITPRIADGATKLLVIIGDPIAQVRAPEVWSALFRANGVNALCVPMHYAAAHLQAALDSLKAMQNLSGLIITIPHKPAAAALADALTPRARQVGAVNLLRREPDGGWLGDIADGFGFTAALAANGQRIEGRTALVVGAGGVGTAIAFALAEAGVTSVSVSDIDPGRAEALAARLRAAGIDGLVSEPRAAGYGLAVNATPLGMKPGDSMPINPDGMGAATIAGEVIMRPPVTPWMLAARARGCFAQPGTDLMDYEVAEMARFFGFAEGGWTPAAISVASR